MSLRIIPRGEWLDFKPRKVYPAKHRGNPHVVHYYGSRPAVPPTGRESGVDLARSFAGAHLARGYFDIGYNFVILRDELPSGLSTVLEGRGDDVRGAHCGDNVGNGYAGVLILYSASTFPTDAQLRTLVELTRAKGWTRRTGHREWSATSCPGDRMMGWIERHRTDELDESSAGVELEPRYSIEEVPWRPSDGGGGNGPLVRPYTHRAVRDRVFESMRDAGHVVSKHSDGRVFYVYHWRPGTYGDRFRWGPWASERGRDHVREELETKLGRILRPFSGRRSLYPYL